MKNKILFLFVVLSSTAHAWTISKIIGEDKVKILRASTATMVAAPQELDKNDILFSGNAKVLLQEGSSQIWMAPKTVVKVASLRGLPQDSLTLDLGKVRVTVAPAEARKWKFETRSAVAGVRGTDFFITTNPDQENWCVIEGKVEAKVEGSTDPIVIPAGQGAQLRTGLEPRQVTNNSFQIEQWKDEISENGDTAFIPRFFQTTPTVFPLNDSVSVSMTGLLLYKENYNTDFDDNIHDQANLTRLHLYPGLTYKNGVEWQLTPRISFVGNQPESTVDRDSAPPKISNQNVIATVSEASASFKFAGMSHKWGFQKITLAEQSYMSDAKASSEPITHLGLTAKKTLGAWDFLAALTWAQEGQRPGDGLFPQSLALLEFKIDSGWLDFYGLRVDSKSTSDFNRAVFHQNIVGFMIQDRLGDWDYKLSKIFESGTYQASPSAIPLDTNAGFVDGSVGRYLDVRTRAFVRYLQADDSYIALATAAFYLGLSPSISSVSNLRQLRYGLEYKISNKQYLVWEHIQSNQVSDSGLTNFKAVGAQDSNIGEENDFFLRQDLNEANKITFGLYRYTPHWRSVNSDPSWGAQIFAMFGF